jgi:hypothetical protein
MDKSYGSIHRCPLTLLHRREAATNAVSPHIHISSNKPIKATHRQHIRQPLLGLLRQAGMKTPTMLCGFSRTQQSGLDLSIGKDYKVSS